MDGVELLGSKAVRDLAAELGLRPTKTLGQHFVVDHGTIERIVRTAAIRPDDVVVEVGPGLGSLTLALVRASRRVVAIEVDPVLARALPGIVADRAGRYADRLAVMNADAARIDAVPGPAPTTLVANLPYNVAVPVLLRLLEVLPTLDRGLVMVQSELADRLTAEPGSRTYGVPSAKLAWYARARRAGAIGRRVFWPVPNVDSMLVALRRCDPPTTPASRDAVFALIDAAFAQRRKTLRAALSGWAGSPGGAEEAIRSAGLDPRSRGESLGITDFARLAAHRPGGTSRA